MKICKQCGVEKSLESYHFHPSSKDRHQHVCKDCRSANAKIYFQKLREKNLDIVRDGLPKKCACCMEIKPSTEYGLNRATLGGFKLRCRDCEAARHRKMKYGLTREQQHDLVRSQDFKCAICSISFEGFKFHMDHCHTTGDVRGALCGPCNRAIGLFKESTDALRSAAIYLERFAAATLPNAPSF